MSISPARTAAFDILLRVERESAYSSILLAQYETALSQLDRSLCHELVLGCLRKQLYLDRLISQSAGAKKIDVEVRIALRLGIYQILYQTKVPDYSAINDSVNLVARAKKTSAKGFVNAILRRVARGGAEPPASQGAQSLSVETSHPHWLIEKWIDQFGLDEVTALASSNNQIPPLAFRVIDLSDAAKDVVETKAVRSANVEGCYIAKTGHPEFFELARSGQIYIQDEASQLIASAIAIAAGERFLDVCAAPGGKTGAVAIRSRETAGLIVAGDLHGTRVSYLRENCVRQGARNVAIVQYDAERGMPFADGAFYSVLVDAPCSGTGTIRHNPEIRYRVQSEELAALADKQLKILKAASKLVMKGGSIVYSTCSLEVEENEDVCRVFLESERSFTNVVPGVPFRFVTGRGFARTLPHRDNMDGFFMAEFRRS